MTYIKSSYIVGGVAQWLERWSRPANFPILRQTAGWMSDYLAVKPSAIGQPTWPTQPSIPQGSVNEYDPCNQVRGLRGEDLAWLTGAQYMPAGCNCGPNSPLARTLGCHCVRRGIIPQSLPVSCHFRGCKVPLFRIVSGAVSSELAFI